MVLAGRRGPEKEERGPSLYRCRDVERAGSNCVINARDGIGMWVVVGSLAREIDHSGAGGGREFRTWGFLSLFRSLKETGTQRPGDSSVKKGRETFTSGMINCSNVRLGAAEANRTALLLAYTLA